MLASPFDVIQKPAIKPVAQAFSEIVVLGDCIMLITVAIPCYKSSHTLPVVVEKICEAFNQKPVYDYQIVLVNDGSPDQGLTRQTIRELCSENSRIVGVDLSRNFGQAAAKLAALPYVKGDILVYMDDDGQHEPHDLFKLVSAIEDGADVAIAKFYGKKHTLFKRAASWLNAELLHVAIRKPKDLVTSSLVAYNRFMIDRLKEYRSPFVSVLGYTLQFTSRIVNVPVEHHARMDGHSGYTLRKMFRLFTDGLFSFSTLPLHLLYGVSASMTVLGMVMLILFVVMTCLHREVSTVLLVGIILFTGGILSFGQALIGEYLGRIFLTQNQLPQYSVRQTWNAAQSNTVEVEL